MTLSVAGLLAELEGSAGRLSRQVVENATAPLKQASRELVAEIVEPASTFGRGIIAKVVLGLLALILVVGALGFGTASLYQYLVVVAGKPLALLIMAGLFAVLAIVSAFIMIRIPLVAPKPATDPLSGGHAIPAPIPDPIYARVASVDEIAAAADAEAFIHRNDVFPQPGLDEMIATLGAVGLEREQAGLQAGLALARRMTPAQLVVVGGLAAFLAGRRINQTF